METNNKRDGIRFNEETRMYTATISIHGHKIDLGNFRYEAEAIQSYNFHLEQSGNKR